MAKRTGNKAPKDPALGKRIKEMRARLHETQTVFGERFSVEQATVSRWEKGFLPERSLLPKLAELANLPEAEFVYGAEKVRTVPLISWVSASSFTARTPTSAIDAIKHLTVGDLPGGDYFALTVVGDSMDRIAPDGAIIIINRNEIDLKNRRFYVFELRGETTFKRIMLKPQPWLSPFSTNSEHDPIVPENPEDIHVLGRAVRVILDI